MRKLKSFYYIYTKSLLSLDYYKDVLGAKVSLSIKYFVTMGLLFSLLLTVKLSYTYIPMFKQGIGEMGETAKLTFPSDLVVTIKDGKWSINKPEPLEIALPKPGFASGPGAGNTRMPKNFIVLYQQGTIEDLDKLDTLMLVNSKNILVREDSGFRAYPLENLPNGEIRKQDFDMFVDKAFTLLLGLANLGALFIFLWAVFTLVALRGVYSLLMAVLVWFIGLFAEVRLKYSQAAKITLHTITLPMTIYVVAKLFMYTIPFAFWFSLLHLFFVVVVVVYLAKQD